MVCLSENVFIHFIIEAENSNLLKQMKNVTYKNRFPLGYSENALQRIRVRLHLALDR